MPKPSHREKLLREGLKVVLERGYAAASVRDIVRAAGVPQGSFSNHFPSKELFAHEVLELYFSTVRENLEKTLGDSSRPPLRRLGRWLDVQIAFLKSMGFRTGCLIGNMGIEAVEQSDSLRRRLAAIFSEIDAAIVACLESAVASGDLPPSTRPRELAAFFYASWHGAILQSKVEQSGRALARFKKIVFEQLLVPGRAPVAQQRQNTRASRA